MGIAYNTSIVRDGLVLHLDAANIKSYPGSGTTWFDLSGNNIHGTLQNTPVYSSNDNGYFEFDGTGNYVSFTGHSSFLNTAGDVSFETTFIHNNASGGIAGIIQIGDFTGTYMSNSNLSIQTNGDNSDELVSLNENQWYHTICTFESGSQYKLYVNGSLVDTVSTTDTSYSLSTTGYVGRRVAGGIDLFSGKISTAKIYNRVLSPNEIQQNFEALRGRYGI